MSADINILALVTAILVGYVVTQLVTAFMLYFILSRLVKAEVERIVIEKSNEFFNKALRDDIERSVANAASRAISVQLGNLITNVAQVHDVLVSVSQSIKATADKIDRLHDICPLGRNGDDCKP